MWDFKPNTKALKNRPAYGTICSGKKTQEALAPSTTNYPAEVYRKGYSEEEVKTMVSEMNNNWPGQSDIKKKPLCLDYLLLRQIIPEFNLTDQTKNFWPSLKVVHCALPLSELQDSLQDNLPFGLLASCTVALTKCITSLSLQDARACLVKRTANARQALVKGKFDAFLKGLKKKVES